MNSEEKPDTQINSTKVKEQTGDTYKELKDKKHSIKCLWIIPLKWGIAGMTVIDVLIAGGLLALSAIAYKRE